MASAVSNPTARQGQLFRQEKTAIEDFLQNFLVSDAATGEATTKYMIQLQAIANRRSESLVVHLDDLENYTDVPELVTNIESNTFQYLSLIADAADAVMPAATDVELSEDVFDIMMEQRVRNQEAHETQATEDGIQRHPQNKIPSCLTRRYDVLVVPRSQAGRLAMRGISSPQIGHLVCFRGIVTQVTDVRPMMTVATYLNDEDGKEYFQEVTGKTFSPIVQMPVTVAGVTMLGLGDPRFTPDIAARPSRNLERVAVAQAADRLADAVEAMDAPPDVVLVHDPAMADEVYGEVPLVLAGLRALPAEVGEACPLGAAGEVLWIR